MGFCLPKQLTEKFKEALASGRIDPAKLSEMDSAARHSFFEDIVGKENAKDVNALFESKLLLKNQQAGMINWAKKVAGISEAAKTDLISRITRLDKVLTAADKDAFLQDLASKKLGTEVSFDEAQKIVELSKSTQESKAAVRPQDKVRSDSRLKYGADFVAEQNYLNDLKNSNKKTTLESVKNEFKNRPVQAAYKYTAGKALDVFGLSKALNAAFDNSYFGNQGFRTIFSNPKEWATNFAKSFVDIKDQLKKSGTNNDVMDGIKADIYSRPNALNGNYDRMKLDIGINNEEAFPTSLPEKIPGIGRLFKAGEVAYNGGAMRLRADIADKVIEMRQKIGEDLTDKDIAKSWGSYVNSITGRGSFGELADRAAGVTNVVLFSPRSLKSIIDQVTGGVTQRDASPATIKASMTNLLKITTAVAIVLGTAHAMNPDSVELDPTSSDFGKIKVGNTRYDVTAGHASLVTLLARIFTGQTKSSVTGKKTLLNSGKYGAATKLDVLYNFFENKLSPAASVLKDLAKGQTFQGDKPTVANEAANLFTPLPVKNAQELLTTPGASNVLIGTALDMLGVRVNTYAPKKK